MTNSGAGKSAAQLAQNSIVLEDLLQNGQGVGRVDGLVTFVDGGLPGERVKIFVDAIRRNYVTGHVTHIETRSPDRVDFACQVFPQCGGCQTLHFRRAAELAWKQRLVAEAFARIGGLNVNVDRVISAQADAEQGYRNKVSLVTRRVEGQPRAGFFAARSHRIVPIERCPVTIPALNLAIERVVALISEMPGIFSDLRHVVIRASQTGPQLVISFNSVHPNGSLQASVREILRRLPSITGLVSNWQPENENAIFGRRSAVLWGSPITSERIANALISAGITSFFQINTSILERIAHNVLELLGGARRVIDLYCGVGTFGVILGKHGVASVGVESFKPSVDQAVANAAENGITCAAFECADVAEALGGQRGKTLAQGTDAAILDPPRKGCEPEVLAALMRHRIPRLVYVSCNQATLARDAKVLVEAGYRIARTTPFDMFPGTGHVEVLADFQRN